MAKFYMTYKESEKIECKLMQNEINNGNREASTEYVTPYTLEHSRPLMRTVYSFKGQFRDDEVPRAPARDVLSNILYSLTRENEHDAEWIALQRKLSSNSFVVKLARV